MTSYLQQLRQSKDKATVAFQEFALSTKTYEEYLFCFFEGNDNPYYVPRIKTLYDKIIPINCGGREKVLKVYELIKNKEEYNKYSKAFFIDRDFNNILDNNNDLIFETPCYSIENLYVNIDTFKEILIHEFQLSPNDSSFEVCISLFNDRFQEFNSAVTLFNSWYACLIEIRNEQNIFTGVQLEEKLPKGFVSITLQNVTSNYEIEKIKQVFTESPSVDDETLQSKLSEFENCDSKEIFRGKYQMDFLITILQLIIDDSKNAQSLIKDKINFSFDGALNHKRALNIFSNYANTPESLIDFLKSLTTHIT
tara:strand:+ start:6880 stop:7806 length:927 start_codon:yes stop_codon:yes gene_type:complete